MVHALPTTVVESWTEREVNGPTMTFSLEVSEGVLWFKAGVRAWRLNDASLSFAFETSQASATSSFTVNRSGQDELVFRYRHVGRALMARIDPTYDALDAANDHPLLVVAQQGRSIQWQQAQLGRVLRRHGAA